MFIIYWTVNTKRNYIPVLGCWVFFIHCKTDRKISVTFLQVLGAFQLTVFQLCTFSRLRTYFDIPDSMISFNILFTCECVSSFRWLARDKNIGTPTRIFSLDLKVLSNLS